MKLLSRRVGVALGMLVAAAGLVGPRTALAQFGSREVAAPDNVPWIMVLPFRGPDRKTGQEAANRVRDRLSSDVSIKKMYVLPERAICDNLKASGFPCDTAPDPITAKLLGGQLRAEEYVNGTVTRHGPNYTVKTSIVLTRDNTMVQPLPPATARNLGDAAKQVSRFIQAARKELPAEQKCENAIRDGKPQAAATAARRAIAAYPQSTIGRICLADAYTALKYPPDSIIGVASRVIQIDPRSKPALQMLAQAYKAQGNTDKAVQTWTQLVAADPRNVTLVSQVTNYIAATGRAAVAKPIILQAVQQNPGDPDLLHLKWLILLATNDWNNAIATGEELVASDSAMADTTFFMRLAAAYAADSQPQKAAEATSRGVAKFPKNAALWSLHAQTLRLAGQAQQAVQAADKAIALDPKAPHVWVREAQAQMDLKQSDSVVASLDSALAHGQDTSTVGQFLLVMGNQQYTQAADTSHAPQIADFQHAIATLARADSIAPSPQAKFLIGVSNFRIGDLAVRQNQKDKTCNLAQEAQSAFVDAQVNITAGGSVDPQVAQQLLGAMQQYSPAVNAQLKRYCKKSRR